MLDSAITLRAQDPDAALLLFDRIAYFYSDDDSASFVCQVNAAELLMRKKRYSEAAVTYQKLAADAEDSMVYEMFAYAALCHLLAHQYDHVITLTDTSVLSAAAQTTAYYKLVLYKGFAYQLLNDYKKAAAHFSILYPLLSANDSARLADLNQKMLRTGLRSPKVAYVMSLILPGSGQLYSSHAKEALNSFVVNGVFIGASIFIGITYTILDGALTGYMLVPRYYIGGAEKAGTLAKERNRKNAEKLFESHRSFFEKVSLDLNR